jgi:Patatin phospholipase
MSTEKLAAILVLDAGEDHSKDIDFSRGGIKHRWQAGYSDTSGGLMQAPWTHEFDRLEGLIIHQAESGRMRFEGGIQSAGWHERPSNHHTNSNVINTLVITVLTLQVSPHVFWVCCTCRKTRLPMS